MLYYIRIGDFEGVDYSNGQDCAGDTALVYTVHLLPLLLLSKKKLPVWKVYL